MRSQVYASRKQPSGKQYRTQVRQAHVKVARLSSCICMLFTCCVMVLSAAAWLVGGVVLLLLVEVESRAGSGSTAGIMVTSCAHGESMYTWPLVLLARLRLLLNLSIYYPCHVAVYANGR